MSAIEWTDKTWNPVTGCDRVSPGCAHCYALDLAARLKGMGQAKYQRDGDPRTSGPGFGVTLHPQTLDEPLRWRKPRMVFVNSMSDLFHEEIPDDFITRVFLVMAEAHQHTFQILTKRPERVLEWMQAEWWHPAKNGRGAVKPGKLAPLPPNVWLGVSIENRRFVGRADVLRETPAAVRFISAEPLLGPLAYDDYSTPLVDEPDDYVRHWADDLDGPELDLTGIDWLIVGGESGHGHRPMRGEWARDLRDAAQTADTAFFFKQWGGIRPKSGGRELDGRTWDELPAGAGLGVPAGQLAMGAA